MNLVGLRSFMILVDVFGKNIREFVVFCLNGSSVWEVVFLFLRLSKY